MATSFSDVREMNIAYIFLKGLKLLIQNLWPLRERDLSLYE